MLSNKQGYLIGREGLPALRSSALIIALGYSLTESALFKSILSVCVYNFKAVRWVISVALPPLVVAACRESDSVEKVWHTDLCFIGRGIGLG